MTVTSPAARDLSQGLSFVETSLNFTHPDSDRQLLDRIDRSKSVRRFDPRTVQIFDARPIAEKFSLDQNGFALLRRSTAVTDFHDPEQAQRVYYPEIERLIRELTGAERVLAFGAALRTDSPDRREELRQLGPQVDW